jgi:hypothetical protein
VPPMTLSTRDTVRRQRTEPSIRELFIGEEAW